MTSQTKTPRPRRRRLRRVLFWAILLSLVGTVLFIPLHQRWQREEAVRLERARDELRAELARLIANDPRLSEAPPGGVLIGAPAPFTSRLAHQLVGGLLEHTEIHLTNLRVRKKGQVRVGTFLGKMKPGTYALDVKLTEMRGRLKAGEPEIRFEDGGARVKVPATIREGQGRATIRFQWESKGLAGLACGDVDVTENVEGRVVPRTYPVDGTLELVLEGDTVTAVPRVPDLEIRLAVEPSKASWRAVDRLLERQGFRCRTALKLVDVPKVLGGLLDRGFKVKIPGRIFKPIRLPAAFHDSVTVEGTTYALGIEPRGLEAVQDILWYGADLSAEVHAPSPEAPPVVALPAASPVPVPGSTAPVPEPTRPSPEPWVGRDGVIGR